MAETPTDVLVAGYQDIDTANNDFESAAVGAVAGGLVGKFVDHRLQHEIHDKIGENLPPGSAGMIAVFDDEQRLGIEQALGGALLRSVVQSDKEGVSALKDSLAEAMGKFSPDRTVLPTPDRNFGGTIGRTMSRRAIASRMRARGSAGECRDRSYAVPPTT